MYGQGYKPADGTFAILDKIVTILGTTNTSFWPGLSAGDTNEPSIPSYGNGVQAESVYCVASGAGAGISVHLEPHQHPSGIYSYRIRATGDRHITPAGDKAYHSFGDASVDSPFSLGIWVYMLEAVGTARSLISKYRTTAATAREYDFRFTTAGKLVMELYDESATASEIATSTGTALTPGIWQFVTMTYDGGETAPVINLYLNGTSVHDGTSVETGVYVAMENLTTPLQIGARDIYTAPAQTLNAYIALPFICGKELSPGECSSLDVFGRILLGL